MNDYYAVMSIGPVQSFIAAARKIEDLWSGSYLLSHLVETGMKVMTDHSREYGVYDVEFIFPAVDFTATKEFEDVASLPNRFTVRLHGESEDIKRLLLGVQQAMQEKITELSKRAIQEMFGNYAKGIPEEMMQSQINNLLEVFWAIEEKTGTFEKDRKRLEKKLASVKNQRPVDTTVQFGPVCSVCGEREALHDGDDIAERSIGEMNHVLRTFWARRLEVKKMGAPDIIKDGEHLCGVCLTKRHLRKDFQEQAKLENPQSSRQFERFRSIGDFISKGSKESEQRYYALLLIDGDNMGKHFSAADDEEGNRKLSKRLSAFAEGTVPNLVNDSYNGRLIYAGGDDVLAFFHIDQVLDAGFDVREAFAETMGNDATASGGIVIAHEKTPLNMVMKKLRAMEKKAKSYSHNDSKGNKQEKDAFAISVMARGGEIREVAYPWEFENKNGERIRTTDVLSYLETSLNKEMSSTFLYRFGELFLPLLNHNMGNKVLEGHMKDELRDELLRSELKRLVKRSLLVQLPKAEIEKMVEKKLDALQELERLAPSTLQFVHTLEILRFLSVKNHLEGKEDNQ